MATTGVPAEASRHLWLVGLIAVLFNGVGVFDFLMIMTRGAAYMASSGMTPAQITHYLAMPPWMTIIWAIGVFGAFAASILLLRQRQAALPTFVVSLAAFSVSVLYHDVFSDGGAIMGRQMAMTNVVIAAMLLFFIWYARLMTSRHVLR